MGGGGAQDEMEAVDERAEPEWAPPQGQTGDGRSSLNDKLGY
jgi:hypothetical protein